MRPPALLDAASEAGFPDAKVGIAGSCIAAAAATRERGTALRIVPPGADRRYLRRRALALVPMPADLRETLELLGLKTCGELAALSPADVELRFGPAGVAAHGAHLPSEHAAWDARGSAGIAPFARAHPPSPGPREEGPELTRGVLSLCLRRLPAPRPVRVREGAGRRPLGVDFQAAQGDALGGGAREGGAGRGRGPPA